ncbi:MAG: hypothetical protein DRI90_28100 [Deltaproteobacteria bacterium]|nr:MAG: hypothetical protein DRI90_28100 [Deltaproteobacteria bacterium]
MGSGGSTRAREPGGERVEQPLDGEGPRRAQRSRWLRGRDAAGPDGGGVRRRASTDTDSEIDRPVPANPRRRLVLALTEAVGAAIEAGDLHAARVAHEALGRLIAPPEPGAATVADLNCVRGRHGR